MPGASLFLVFNTIPHMFWWCQAARTQLLPSPRWVEFSGSIDDDLKFGAVILCSKEGIYPSIPEAIWHFILCQMFIVQVHWSIPSHMTICNQAYFLPKTILTGQYYSILFSIMVLLLWRHIVLLFDRNVTQVLWYLTSQYAVTIVAPCPRL